MRAFFHGGISLQSTRTGIQQERPDKRTQAHLPLLVVLLALVFMTMVWFSLAFLVPKPLTVDERVHAIASQLRCPVCQDESLADATAPVALDLRQQIRQQVVAGRSDQQIIQFFVNRYGEQTIIWTPQWQGFSLLIWLVPIALLLAGCVLVYLIVRDWQASVVLRGQKQALSGSATGGADEKVPVDSDLERYRQALERELLAEDPLFARPRITTETKEA